MGTLLSKLVKLSKKEGLYVLHCAINEYESEGVALLEDKNDVLLDYQYNVYTGKWEL